MKTRTLILAISMMSAVMVGNSFAGRIEWGDVTLESVDQGYVVKVVVKGEEDKDTRGLLRLKLLDDKYQPAANITKRVYLSKGTTKTEEILIPLAEKPVSPDSYAIEVSFGESRLLKRNYQYKGGREIDVLGQNEWIAGSNASLRVNVSDTQTGKGLAGIGVGISLTDSDKKIHPLWTGKTNDDGTIDAVFTAPDGLGENAILFVAVDEEGAKETIQRDVILKNGYKILLTSDKPAYQPMQTIHLRALGLHQTTLKPLAQKTVVFEVEDPKGNKVFKEEGTTSEFGISAAVFQLADEIIEGRYTLRVTLDGAQTEKKVRVERYVLPQFKVKIDTDKPFYLAGQKIKGTVQADYFYGKPVKESKVTVRASAFDVGFNEFAQVTVDTNADGRAEFEVEIPEMLVGQPLFKGDTQVTLDIEIHDPADHKENKYHSVTVARAPIIVDILPESGTLVPGLENDVYLLTRFPTGETASCKLTVSVPETNLNLQLETDKNGSTSFSLTPGDGTTTIRVTAVDKDGNTATNEKAFDVGKVVHSVLLRTDSPVYKVGDTVRFDVIATGFLDDTLFLDLVKDRQTVTTKTIRLKDGKGSLELPIDASLFGAIEASAYKILTSSEMVRDTKRIFVRKADALTIAVGTDRDEYKPAEQAQLTFKVTDKDGKGKPTAIGLDIVDESVYALAESKPGLLEVFFTLEKEILEPKVEVHGFDFQEIVQKPGDWSPEPPVRILGKAALSVYDEDINYSLRVDSRQDRRSEADVEIEEVCNVLYANGVPGSLNPVPVESLLVGVEAFQSSDTAIDPWGNPYWAIPHDVGEPGKLVAFAVASSGPDGKLGTEDDVSRDYAANVFPKGNLDGRVLPPGFGEKDNVPVDTWWMNNAVELEKQFGDVPDVEKFIRSAGGAVDTDEEAGLKPLRQARERLGGGHVRTLGRGLRRGKEGLVLMDGAEMLMAGVAMQKGAVADAMAVNGEAPPVPIAAEVTVLGGELGVYGSQPPPIEKPRVRSWFPETLLSEPAIITDDKGMANMTLALADSITTWRLTGQANTLAGEIGSATAGIRVFQDFFVDIDLPVALTRNDEVEIPVAVANYLKVPQTVEVELQQEEWFELLGGLQKQKITVPADSKRAVHYRLKAKKIGDYSLTVFGYGEQKSDAASRPIEVIPDGKEFIITKNDRLEKMITENVEIPNGTIDGANKLLVKIYPGLFSQVMEGLDNILRMPSGCFEQTSSTSYPNILILDYMRRTEQIKPEIEMKAKQYINMGYQRLFSYEVDGGGFEAFGNAPANKVLTAYGLLQFSDMAKVHPVDPALIPRTQEWLVGQQNEDGSWSPDQNFVHSEMWGQIQNSNLLATAWIVEGLAGSGYKGEALDKALGYIYKHAGEAKDTYTLAHLAAALVGINPEEDLTVEIMKKLRDLAVEEKDTAYWEAEASFSFAQGDVASIEVSALACATYMKAGKYPDVTQKVLNYLIKKKDPNGTWCSTQSTVLALKAFILAMDKQTVPFAGTVTVKINGQEVPPVEINEKNSDVLRQLNLSQYAHVGTNKLELSLSGEGNLLYQIVGKYYIPWQDRLVEKEPLEIKVDYDRTNLRKDESVLCKITVSNTRPGVANMVMVDVGIPPGFKVETEDLDKYEKARAIEKYSMTGRQLTLYLDKLESNEPRTYEIKMKAGFPIRAKTPESKVYEYYNPDVLGMAVPIDVEVEG